jgi:hypothetical protein
MLIGGLVLLGANAYYFGGPTDAQHIVIDSLKKLAVQVPAGIIAIWLAGRFIESDFGDIFTIALKIAGIAVLAEAVHAWVFSYVPFEFFAFMAGLAVVMVGYFWLFDLGKWETIFLVILNFVVTIGVYYVVDNYFQSPQASAYRTRTRGRR